MPLNMQTSGKIPVLLTGSGGLLAEHVLNALRESGRQVYGFSPTEGKSQQFSSQNSPEFHLLTEDLSDSGINEVEEIWHVVDTAHEKGARALAYVSGKLAADARTLAATRVVVVLCNISLDLLGFENPRDVEDLEATLRAECAEHGIICGFISIGLFLKSPAYRGERRDSSASVFMRLLLSETKASPNQLAVRELPSTYLRFLSPEDLEEYLANLARNPELQAVRLYGHKVVTVADLTAILHSLCDHTKSPLILPEQAAVSVLKAILRDNIEQSKSTVVVGYSKPVQVDDVASEAAQLVRSLSGDSAMDTFATQFVTTVDNVPLRVFSRKAYDAALVFVNAYGMPTDLLVPLARELSCFDFYTWESRYVPVLSSDFDRESTTVTNHAQDLLTILDHFGLDVVHLAGWCTGAQVCLRFAHDHPDRVRSLSLINGAFALESLKKVDFHKSILGLLERAASGPDAAAMTQKLAYSNKTLQNLKEGDLDRTNGGEIPQQDDPHLAQMLSQLFCTPATLYRYATMAIRLWDEPGHAWTTNIRSPTLVLTSSCDIMSPPHTSEEISVMLRGSSIVELKGGDHYVVYNRYKDVADILKGFIQSKQD